MSVNIKSIEEIKARVEKIYREVGSIENSLSSIRNSLDSDIRNRNGIDTSFQKVQNEIVEEEMKLKKAGSLLESAIDSYQEAERTLIKELDKLSNNLKPEKKDNTPKFDGAISLNSPKVGKAVFLSSIMFKFNTFGIAKFDKILNDLFDKTFNVGNKHVEEPVTVKSGIPPLSGVLVYNIEKYDLEVLLMQKRLNELGYTDKNGNKLKEDGYFGSNTLFAVNKYKEDYGLWNYGEYKGKVGQTTWEHMFTNVKVPYSPGGNATSDKTGITPGGTLIEPKPNPGNSNNNQYDTYTVKSGDTLSAIARRYGTTVAELAKINNIANVNLISVGQIIKIPKSAGGLPSSSTVPKDTTPPSASTPPSTSTPPSGEGLTYNTNGNVSSTAACVPVKPIVMNTGERSAENYSAVIDQFNVATNPRYKIRDTNGDGVDDTFCNIFGWDVTVAMGAELPHWVDNKTNQPYTYDSSKSYSQNAQVAHELNANSVADWVKNYGSNYGWRAVTREEAQAAANLGKPTIGVWKNTGGIGHVIVVRPNLTNDGEIHIAQAGASNYNDGVLSNHASSKFRDGVLFYVHD